MAFLMKKKDKKNSSDEGTGGLTRSASMGGVTIRRPKSKNKAVTEFYSVVDQICHLLIQDESNFMFYLVSMDLGLSSIPRMMNTFGFFRQLVRTEFHYYRGDTSLLLRNTSNATKWMKGIVEAESAEMVLLEKKVLWLLNKSCETNADKGASSPVRDSPQTPTKKSSFLAPSVAIHQQIIQKEETHEGAGFEWCENGEAEVIQGFDKDLRRLCNCIMGILYCCSQVTSLCRLVMATSDEVKKQKLVLEREIPDEEAGEDEQKSGGDNSGSTLTYSSSAPNQGDGSSEKENSNIPGVQSSPSPEKKEKKGKEKEKKAKKGAKATSGKRMMRRKVSDEERQLYCWTVTNIILLHFAVPVIASRSVKCKPEKKIVKFSKLVARSIMKVAANSDFGKGTDLERFNPVVHVLHQPYLNFCQDAVENGALYASFAPEIHRSCLQHLRDDMTKVTAEERSEIKGKIANLCDEAIKKAANTKKISRQLSTEPADPDDNLSNLSEWRAPSIIDDAQLDNDDYSEATLQSMG